MKIKIEFEIELPELKHTEEELDEFLRFEFNDNGVLSGGNPFNMKRAIRIEPIFGTFEWNYLD